MFLLSTGDLPTFSNLSDWNSTDRRECSPPGGVERLRGYIQGLTLSVLVVIPALGARADLQRNFIRQFANSRLQTKPHAYRWRRHWYRPNDDVQIIAVWLALCFGGGATTRSLPPFRQCFRLFQSIRSGTLAFSLTLVVLET